jgi:hypothetical protein
MFREIPEERMQRGKTYFVTGADVRDPETFTKKKFIFIKRCSCSSNCPYVFGYYIDNGKEIDLSTPFDGVCLSKVYQKIESVTEEEE